MKELIEYIYLHEKDISDIFNKVSDKTSVEIQNLYHQIIKTQMGIAIGGLIFGLIMLIVSSILLFLMIKNDQTDNDLVCIIIAIGIFFGIMITLWNLVSLIEWINEPTLKALSHIKDTLH